MSLKPNKKSDLNKDWMKKRRDYPKKIQPEYHLIVTEGTNTEPNYFKEMQRKINMHYPHRVHLEVHGEGRNTVYLLNKAKAYVEENPNRYKHIWIVYDTDDFPPERVNKVNELCGQYSNEDHQYHAIWSNQCIELWFLLHFSFVQSDMYRKDYFEKLSECFVRMNVGNYTKNRTDVFSLLYPMMDYAIENAERLNKINEGKLPSDSKPGTMVFQLVEKMRPYM